MLILSDEKMCANYYCETLMVCNNSVSVLCAFLSYTLVFLYMNMLLMVFLRRTQSTGQEPLRRQGSSAGRAPQPLSAQAIKHIWVRTALFEKVLDKIVQYIVDNAR